MRPCCREVIWGGRRLREIYGYKTNGDHTGEAWVVSANENGQSVANRGEYEGKTLKELWDNHRELFGNLPGEEFPLLVKIIDAREDLSIQVHPDDDYARAHENGARGKNECWYILDCLEDGDIIIGHHAQNKEQLKTMVENQQWRPPAECYSNPQGRLLLYSLRYRPRHPQRNPAAGDSAEQRFNLPPLRLWPAAEWKTQRTSLKEKFGRSPLPQQSDQYQGGEGMPWGLYQLHSSAKSLFHRRAVDWSGRAGDFSVPSLYDPGYSGGRRDHQWRAGQERRPSHSHSRVQKDSAER